MTIKTAAARKIDRQLMALKIDMALECTNNEFLAMCDRFDDLDEQRKSLAAVEAWAAAYERGMAG